MIEHWLNIYFGSKSWLSTWQNVEMLLWTVGLTWQNVEMLLWTVGLTSVHNNISTFCQVKPTVHNNISTFCQVKPTVHNNISTFCQVKKLQILLSTWLFNVSLKVPNYQIKWIHGKIIQHLLCFYRICKEISTNKTRHSQQTLLFSSVLLFKRFRLFPFKCHALHVKKTERHHIFL
jgi:hypothetical protein